MVCGNDGEVRFIEVGTCSREQGRYRTATCTYWKAEVCMSCFRKDSGQAQRRHKERTVSRMKQQQKKNKTTPVPTGRTARPATAAGHRANRLPAGTARDPLTHPLSRPDRPGDAADPQLPARPCRARGGASSPRGLACTGGFPGLYGIEPVADSPG